MGKCVWAGQSKSLVSKQIIVDAFSLRVICFPYRKVTSVVTDSCICSPLLQGKDPQWHWLAKYNEDTGSRDSVTCHADTMQVCTSQNPWSEFPLVECFCAHPPSEQRPLAVAKALHVPWAEGGLNRTVKRVSLVFLLSLVLVSEELLMGVRTHLTLNASGSAAEMLRSGLGR